MSAVRLGTRFALCAGFGLIFTACGSSAPEETAGAAGSTVPVVDNFPGAAGQSTGNGFKGWSKDGSGAGGGGAAGTAANAGSSAAAGKPAAGSGGSAGAAGSTAGTSGAAAAAGSGTTVEPDPLDIFGMDSAGAGADPDPIADLFGMAGAGAPTCTGLVCGELADCQDLYPEENASCKFTRCEDLECK